MVCVVRIELFVSTTNNLSYNYFSSVIKLFNKTEKIFFLKQEDDNIIQPLYRLMHTVIYSLRPKINVVALVQFKFELKPPYLFWDGETIIYY
jgi:hypothetical protein